MSKVVQIALDLCVVYYFTLAITSAQMFY